MLNFMRVSFSRYAENKKCASKMIIIGNYIHINAIRCCCLLLVVVVALLSS